MSSTYISVEKGIQTAGVGKFQYRLFVIFGLVWLADAMQVLSIGFSAPSIAKTFGKTVPEALQTGTFFFIGMLIGAFMIPGIFLTVPGGLLASRIGIFINNQMSRQRIHGCTDCPYMHMMHTMNTFNSAEHFFYLFHINLPRHSVQRQTNTVCQ